MNIGDITKTIATIAMDYGKEVVWTTEQLNKVYSLVNYDIIKDLIKEAEISGIITDSLLPFKSDPTTVNLTVGVGDMPDDYFHLAKCTASGRKVDILTEKEDEERETSPVRMASTRYPTGILYDDAIRIKPTTIASISIVYYKRPTTPVYAVSASNGILTYSSGSSTQFDYNDEYDIDIVRRTLEYMGITMSNEQILPYIQNKKIEEKQ